MKICYFHAGFSLHGGIERAISIIIRSLRQQEAVDIHCLSLNASEPLDFYSLPSGLRLDYLFEEPINMKNAFIKGGIKRLVDYLKTNQIDILIACGSIYFPLSCIAGKLAGTKVVCWEHTNPKIKNEFAFQGISRSIGAKFSDMNVLIAEEAKEYYVRHFRKKRNVVIYNAADDRLFENQNCYQKDSRTLISVGRLTYAKNYQLLIDIAEILLKKHNDWSWHIYGDGEERDELEARIIEKGLVGKLVLKGTVADLYNRYPEYAAIIMTSRYEGFPMVLIEAAAKGLPMVSFDISTGPKEIIDDNANGVLIPNGDADAMLSKLESLIADAEMRERFSIAAKLKAYSFRVSNIEKQWRALFKDLIK